MKAAQVTQAVGSLNGQSILLSSRTFVQNLLATYYTTGMIEPDDSNLKQAELSVESTDDVISAALFALNLNQVVLIPSLDGVNDTAPPDELLPATFMTTEQLSNYTSVYDSYVLGPVKVGNRFYMSFTRLVVQNTADFTYKNIGGNSSSDRGNNIGYITVVTRAKPIFSVIKDPTGLESTGDMALVQLQRGNLDGTFSANGSYILGTYVLPTTFQQTLYNTTFVLGTYKEINPLEGFPGSFINEASVYNGKNSGGYAPASVLNAQWTVLIYQDHEVIYGPLYRLRNMLLIAVFSIGVGMFIGTMFLSSWAVKPILRLQSATEQSANNSSNSSWPGSDKGKKKWLKWLTPWVFFRSSNHRQGPRSRQMQRGPADPFHDFYGNEKPNHTAADGHSPLTNSDTVAWYVPILERVGLRPSDNRRGSGNSSLANNIGDNDNALERRMSASSTGFRIPEKVSTRRRIKDELTDLTEKFNEMTDELRKQYSILEERVIERTREIESARLSAEAANASKSLFIANITHELRTPLNGILGMTAVSMDEEDPKKIQESLKIIFKSGELLLHLLTELLTFSKNQVGNEDLEEKEFMIPEAVTQLNAIFGEQSKTAQIDLSIVCVTEGLTDLVFYGDINRILQIVINLISNSLKFTPKGGRVDVTISGIISKHVRESVAEESGRSTKTGASSHKSSISSASPLTSRRRSSNERTPKRYPSEVLSEISGKQENSTFTKDTSSIETAATKTTTSNELEIDDPHYRQDIDDEIHDKVTALQPREHQTDVSHSGHEDHDSDSPDDETATVIFQVSDTGPGIAPHMQNRIFEAFVQGELALSQRTGGAGLGLSICRQLATLMGGTVELSSELGKGSTFTFKVPLHVVKDGSKYVFADLSTVKDWPEYEVYNFDTIERRAEEAVEDVNSRMVRWSMSNPVPSTAGTASSANNTGATYTGETAGTSATTANLVSNTAPSLASRVSSNTSILSSHLTHNGKSFESHSEAEQRKSEVPRRPPMARNTSHRSREDEKKICFPVSVLVAEDNKVNQEVMIRMLKLEGIENITIANDGLEAIAKLNAALADSGKGYDIIFMDVQMPNLDGIEATKNIRNDIHFNGPIVAVSAFADSSNIDDCLSAGMNHFLAKPLRRPHLHRLLLSVLIKEGQTEDCTAATKEAS
ncbi:Sln1p [Sugiyamaella lignohabitans]|uniref:histidine kinase n=1 Tax=Sugiyamaella lignohabitans TaxID=796027 RepID=A0A167CAF7_9ASCO|nr:Sln1p [Sugiyamaella lignohabitans]ANB11429.1 Sln1p [Sugiyamaella lignohabitans]